MAKTNKITGKKAATFGDLTQIENLRKHQAWERTLLDQDVDLDHEKVEVKLFVRLTVYFPCAQCGEEVNWGIEINKEEVNQWDHAPEFDIKDDTNEQRHTCLTCKTVYEIQDYKIIMVENPKYPYKIDESLPHPDEE